jgi:hypothetical protein
LPATSRMAKPIFIANIKANYQNLTISQLIAGPKSQIQPRVETTMATRTVSEQDAPAACPSRMVVAARRFVQVICRRRRRLPGFEFAFMKAFEDGRAPWYLRSLIRKPLREIVVIVLHDVERGFLRETAMVLGEYPMHGCEQFIGHGYCFFSGRYWLSTI